jgi:hypothetical protein
VEKETERKTQITIIKRSLAKTTTVTPLLPGKKKR